MDCKSAKCKRDREIIYDGLPGTWDHLPDVNCEDCGPFGSHWKRTTVDQDGEETLVCLDCVTESFIRLDCATE